MRKIFAPVFVFAATLVTACSGQQASLTAPSAVAAAPASQVHTNLTAPAVSEACRPSANSVVFDADQIGRATVTNNSSCPNEFLYIVWSVSPDDENNQTEIAATGARLAPGETRQLTLGFRELCGTKYQRDVYLGLSDDKVHYSYSDMGNYFFAALGYYQYAPHCDAPPSGPTNPINGPVDVCPNIEGNQASVPAGMALVGGLCVTQNTPPVDVCPNLEGNQATVPGGYTLTGGLCVPVETPIDVCPNLEGAQATVPAGYTLSGGLCVLVPPPPALCTDPSALNFGGLAPCAYAPPPTDVCANIDGIQTTVPAGYVILSGTTDQCVVANNQGNIALCHVEGPNANGHFNEQTKFVSNSYSNGFSGHVGSGNPTETPNAAPPLHPTWNHVNDYLGACTGRFDNR